MKHKMFQFWNENAFTFKIICSPDCLKISFLNKIAQSFPNMYIILIDVICCGNTIFFILFSLPVKCFV